MPRRERLRSSDSTFGADILPPESDWTDRDVEPEPTRQGDLRGSELPDEDDSSFLAEAGPGDAARPEGRRRRRRRGRRREREPGRARHEPPAGLAARDEAEFEEFGPEVEPPRSFARGRTQGGQLDEFDVDELEDAGHEPLDDDDLAGDEIAVQPPRAVEEEIDLELEQEIRREIEEIEELEREMGLRGPADAGPGAARNPARGGRSARGRGLVKPPIQEIFRRGDEVLVQVIKESIGTKGPTLSTYISIPGRYLVLDAGAQPRRRLAQDRR